VIMGILNATPDSFSDGGRYLDRDAAVAHGLQMAAEGADILDVGGESTRPRAAPVPEAEECARVLPVIQALRRRSGALISIDTYKAEVARRAIDAGADLVNDVTGLSADGHMAAVVGQAGVPLVLMHMRGTPETMADLPPSPDVLADIEEGWRQGLARAAAAGVAAEKVILDPGLGFGKNAAENLLILNRLGRLLAFGRPLLVGASRKRFIGAVLDQPVEQRLMGSVAAAAAAVLRGAHVVRVHDVGATRAAVRLLDAIATERVDPC